MTDYADLIALSIERCDNTVLSRLGAGRTLNEALDRPRWLKEMTADGVPTELAEDALDKAAGRYVVAENTFQQRGIKGAWSAAAARVSAKPSYVYLLSGQSGTLLYAGVADSPTRRLAEHARNKEWWPLVARIDLEPMRSRVSAVAREKKIIIQRAPLFNRQHNLGRELESIAELAGLLEVTHRLRGVV